MKFRHMCVGASSLLLVYAASAGAQTAAPAVAAAAAPSAAAPVAAPVAEGMIRIPTGTPVYFSFSSQISSHTAKIDEMFPIVLTGPIVVGGKELVPAGTPGQGQIVHAAKSGWAGKPGELIVAVRFIEYNGQKIPLRRFRMGGGDANSAGGTGADHTGQATTMLIASSATVPIVAPIVFFISGGEKIIQPGTLGNAIVSADTDIPLSPEKPAQ